MKIKTVAKDGVSYHQVEFITTLPVWVLRLVANALIVLATLTGNALYEFAEDNPESVMETDTDTGS